LYAGSLDEVRIYNRALGANEVSLPPADASLIGYWPLDGEAPTVTVVAEPVKAAIITWPDGAAGAPAHWSPAAGAFFRSIERQP